MVLFSVPGDQSLPEKETWAPSVLASCRYTYLQFAYNIDIRRLLVGYIFQRQRSFLTERGDRRHVGSFVEIPVARRRQSCRPAAGAKRTSNGQRPTSRVVDRRRSARSGMPRRARCYKTILLSLYYRGRRTRLATLQQARRRRHGYSAAAAIW